jgi:DNA-binding MarR family transcriptional regulator
MIGGDKPPQELGRYTGFLLNWIGARSRALFLEALSEVDLHPRDFAVLNIIASHPGVTQHEIGAETDIDPSTMVALLDGLEKRGLAERRAHPDDRRKRAVHLTGKGETALARGREIAGAVGEQTFERLTAAERKQLNALLRKTAGLD